MRVTDFDIVVIGGGHAGVEAALAAVRMGSTAAIVTMDARKLALMSCNPAVGGIGKSQLVKEIDALGGLMGQAIDATGIQFRRLNLSRGPAVWSTRAQADRLAYSRYVVEYCARQKNLDVLEGEVTDLIVADGQFTGVRTAEGTIVSCRAAIIATGTFLGGLIHIGKKKIRSGRNGERAAYRLSESLQEHGFRLGRLKTGTPPRLDGDTIDWSRCQIQPGEVPIPFFSCRSKRRSFAQTPCHLTYTSLRTKEIISANFHRSPIFSGQIRSIGPRYCPSIEDKFYRFADKLKHHIFLEPEGNGTSEIYPNGFSTALPEEIQRRAIRTVVGLDRAEITRPGYAIEYDYCPTYQIKPSLESRPVGGLFLAGQINGTSGYEEAAAQGLMAGCNAVLYINKEPPFILDRSEAYIGVLVDDLVTHSITEPYRMFTSRAEYRLALREDNARDRLFEHAERLDLIDRKEYLGFRRLQELTEREMTTLRKTTVSVSDLGEVGRRFTRKEKVTFEALLKQPGVGIPELLPLLIAHDGRFSRDREVLERAAVRIRFKGYIDKQQREIDKFKRLEAETIPEDFGWKSLGGLKREALEKLDRYRPRSLGQAGRIEGVTAGDLAVLSVHLKKHKALRS
ncbi:MAG TPA: tRNA uridine-5-carboxymethylaminomethyl(34) synthesis enzyme MnmG [Acidobacteriota bacterium]|nr:tRNA uridine-5-carboxymethylaminomethyl(34) synthesis enzyme MnmG [Acidobacteriota bacterium]